MNKVAAMLDHIKAREELGVEIGAIQKVWGCVNMLFIAKATIEAATNNIRAGRIRYDREKDVLIVG